MSPTGAPSIVAALDSIRPSRSSRARHVRHRFLRRGRGNGLGRLARRDRSRVEQPMRVVERRAQELAARQVLVGRGDPPPDAHGRGIDGLGITETRQRRAVGAEQEDRLDKIASRLLHGERCKLRIVEGALAHGAIDREGELIADLLGRDLGHAQITAPLPGEQLVRRRDCRLATFDRDVHVRPPRSRARCEAGRRWSCPRQRKCRRRRETRHG